MKLILPPELLAHLESSSYVDERLTERHSDLLFTVPIKDQATPVLIYLLFEHQSSEARLLSLSARLLGATSLEELLQA